VRCWRACTFTVLVAAATQVVQAQPQEHAPGDQSLQADAVEAAELERLLSPETDEQARQLLVARLVAQAQQDGRAAFYLGALYRSGMEHPAQLVERDLETARHWLQKCVEAERCPLLALASLAELELAAGEPKAAMQWAQAWVVLERELDRQQRERDKHRQTKGAPYQYTSYQAYLLERCYKAMGNARNKAELGRAWFEELVRARGTQLDRMLFTALEGPAAAPGGQRLEISAEKQRTKVADADTPTPPNPALALYLYRGAPGGGRPESLHVIEALPTPLGASWLIVQARSVRIKPYEPGADGVRLYAELPMSFNDGQYSLVPDE